jgi:hypothetical protein
LLTILRGFKPTGFLFVILGIGAGTRAGTTTGAIGTLATLEAGLLPTGAIGTEAITGTGTPFWQQALRG